jgi:hypothetical protein
LVNTPNPRVMDWINKSNFKEEKRSKCEKNKISPSGIEVIKYSQE